MSINFETASSNIGRSKAWMNLDGSGTISLSDSYNISSVSDNGTGDYTANLTNIMSDTTFGVTMGCGFGSSTIGAITSEANGSRSTGSVRVYTIREDLSSLVDSTMITMSLLGDLQ